MAASGRSGHPCQPETARSSCDAQLAFRVALTSGFVGICMIDVKNVPESTNKRANALAAHSR